VQHIVDGGVGRFIMQIDVGITEIKDDDDPSLVI